MPGYLSEKLDIITYFVNFRANSWLNILAYLQNLSGV